MTLTRHTYIEWISQCDIINLGDIMGTLFSDVDQTKNIAKIYELFTNLFKHPYVENRIKNIDESLEDRRCYMAFVSTMVSYILSHCYEQAKNYDESIINTVLSGFSFWDKIECKEKLSPSEKFKQFRNCFEHADYYLYIDSGAEKDENNIYIRSFSQICYYFANEKIAGKIDFIEFYKLYSALISLFTKYNKNNKIAMLIIDQDSVRKLGHIRNSRDLEKILENSVIRDISASVNSLSKEVNITIDDRAINDFSHYGTSIKNYEWKPERIYTTPETFMLNSNRIRYFISNKVELGMNQIDIVTRRLTAEEKETIRKHIRFITRNFDRQYTMTDDFVVQALADDYICYKAQDIIFEMFYDLWENDYNSISLNTLQRQIKSRLNCQDDLLALAPGLYLTTIMASANFFLNYLYESNKKGEELFRYSGIDISDIEIENKINDKLLKITDPLLKEKEELTSITKQIKGMEDKLIWAKKQIGILNLPKNKDPQKAEKLQSVNEFINTYDENKRKLDERKQELLSIINNSSNSLPYTDSYHLFRHLRNSVAHGRFKVNFDNGFDSNDLGKSIITFYDIDETKDDKIENANIIIKMNLNRFEKLTKNLASVIYNQIEDKDFYYEIPHEEAKDGEKTKN